MVYLAVAVSALGYFVDIYDLLLFNVFRTKSLLEIGVAQDDLVSAGIKILNWQMAGMLLGGIIWGILGDKLGRMRVLFGSILLYSLASLANAWVSSTEGYAVLRFIAGFGLSGEIGAGITLVSELMPKEKRGYATAIVAGVGVAGASAAGLVGEFMYWRHAYILGGVLGLALLLLRVSVHESPIFQATIKSEVKRGNLLLLFSSPERVQRLLYCVLIGLPIWYITAIMVTFAPEFGRAQRLTEPLITGRILIIQALSMALGDFVSGFASQFLKSRKKVLALFLLMTVLVLQVLFSGVLTKSYQIYTAFGFIGFFTGYWAVFLTSTTENFGTNLRATVTTSVPNFVRGLTIPITLGFRALEGTFGFVLSAQLIGLVVMSLSAFALLRLRETYGISLEYLEDDTPQTHSKPALSA